MRREPTERAGRVHRLTIDSAATGPWADFLIRELVPRVEREFGCGGRRLSLG
ncbi:MAG: hypothetical protein KGL25_09760 [Gammaproteobacteria bacterium]|nr:hypothetical protein [Gammaproteobacteria bacterium]MDE2251673.1 hypothetical protein [Gammaproteobacteria bacterium]